MKDADGFAIQKCQPFEVGTSLVQVKDICQNASMRMIGVHGHHNRFTKPTQRF